MSDDSKTLSRVEDILSDEDYIPTKPMSRIEKLLLEGGGPGGKLPEVTSDDNGKILKVKDGAWDKGEDISGDKLPQVSSQDNGKVLKVVNSEWNIDKDEGDRLPVVTSSDNGKILTVKNGAWDKADRVKDAFYYSVIVSLEDEAVLPTGFGYKLAEAEPKPVYLYNDSTNRLFSPIEIGRTVSGVKEHAKWQCVYTQSNKTYVETIEYNCTSGTDPLVESSTYSKEEIDKSEAVYLPLADYEELTTAEKEDPTKIYFVINEGTKVSPTLSADDGNITTSSTASGYDPWKAFDGSTRTDNNDHEYCYSPWGQHNGEWIAYNFGTKHVFSKVHIRAATMWALTMKYYIEGSEDGETWTNLIANADYVSVSHPALADTPSFVETDILLDTSKGKFSKIRFRQDLSIGYPYSGDRFIVANWDIYAAAASNKPSIYYKNVLYTLDELPATTISDAGKVLKVNEDGLWDKGDAPIPDVNAVQVPPVIFDDNGLKKIDDFSDFPGIKKVYLTQSAYNALTTAEKEDLSKIYYISDYEFYPSDDGKVVIRFNDDGTEKLIFFDGFVDNWSSTPYSNFPEELRTIVTSNATWDSAATILSINYDSEGVVRSGNEQYFGLRTLQDWHVNSCNSSTDGYAAKNKANYAILDMLDNSTYQQSESWSDPYDIPYGYDAIYYGGKEYTEFNIPKELPYVTSSDAGKALVVNSQGIWVKGNIPRTNSVQVPPVIFDNGKLMKISDMTGFPELEKVFVTSEEYSQLTTAQKQDLSKIYYVSPYEFYSFEDGKIIIRTNDNETKWYFNGFEVPSDGTYNVPSEMSSYFAANQSSNAYSDETSETDLGYIELGLNVGVNVIYFQQGLWGGSWIAAGTPVWGVVSKNGGDNQQNTYSDPYDVETPILIYYGGKQYTEYEPAKPYVELTQSEYDALPSSKESDGIIYFING